MRKFKILFSIVFLLFLISFFSQKLFAENIGDPCTLPSGTLSHYPVGCAANGTDILQCAVNGGPDANGNYNHTWQTPWSFAKECSAQGTGFVCTGTYPNAACKAPGTSTTTGASTACTGNNGVKGTCVVDNTANCSKEANTLLETTGCLRAGTVNYACCVPKNPDAVKIAIGQDGCSFTVVNNTVAPVILCADGGFCSPSWRGKLDPSANPPTYTNGYCKSSTDCPVCGKGGSSDHNTELDLKTERCANPNDLYAPEIAPSKTSCPSNQCNPGVGCIDTGGSTTDTTTNVPSNCLNGVCNTAVGRLPTDLSSLLTAVFSIILAIAGLVALGLIIASGYKLMTSQGNPEMVKGIREQLTAAIIGLLFIIFSLIILQIIGHNILSIPGFG